jgi:glycosyltransferase involved in cell wall biosynthesis
MIAVSVIVPCFNEEQTIELLLEALYAQSFPLRQMEVIVADGMSTDRTRDRIAIFQQAHPDLLVKVVDNPAGTIPSGLNRAIEAASGEFIVRLDAHSVPQPDYVAHCKTALEDGVGDNVGGVWEIQPQDQGWQARSIATAAAHPLGVGDALYRYTESAQVVDTVPFGSFRRSLIAEIGAFDESLLTNEDYEFNTRIRQAGGKIWLDPQIRSIYYARASYIELARQYWRYGFWKLRMLRRYPGTLRWRQALPPAFVLSLLVGLLLAFWFSLFAWIFVIELAAYILVLLIVGLQVGIKHRNITLVLGVPLAIATMHLTWGSAFLWSMIQR